MNTHEKKARAAYDAALTAADQWRQTIAQLEHDLAAAEAETPDSPADLAKIADRQVSLAKQLEMARSQLGIRESAVLDAGRAIVAAEADDLQPAINTAQKQVDVIDKKTAELRAAVDTHLQATRETRQQAEAQLRELRRVQGGLRAAVAGDGVRDYFRTLDELPASLHPQTGILPQASFERDIAEIEFRQERERRQAALDGLATRLGVDGGLSIALNDLERPSERWVSDIRLQVQGVEPEKDAPAGLAAFDEAVDLDADASSLARLARHLVDPQESRKYARALANHFRTIKEQAAEMFGVA